MKGKTVRCISWIGCVAFGLCCSLRFGDADAQAPPRIGHVFVIVLENEGYATTFGPHSPAPYLAKTLPGQGALLTQYFGIGHYSLDNYLAMISGQAPNPATQADCERFTEFASGGSAPDGQAVGTGCVYPSSVKTVADQLTAAKLRWRGYMEDMGNDPKRESARCGHPAIGQPDPTQKAEIGDQYATRHDPFVYFHSIIDTPDCAADVVPLSALPGDLARAAATPNYVFITPNLCHDGHDGGETGRNCVDGEPGGLISADVFLRKWVPAITASAAFKQDGLLIVTFDEADFDGGTDAGDDASACCDEQPGPNFKPGETVYDTPSQGAGIAGPGGGRIGAVLLSPFIRPGTVSEVPYNHYSMLRTVEDLFGLQPLGYAGRTGLRAFGAEIFTAPR
jgi:hypothetical protein